MKTHSEKGCEILSGLDRMDDKEYLRYAYRICRYHHERWDGKGYPDGLKGDVSPSVRRQWESPTHMMHLPPTAYTKRLFHRLRRTR